MMLVHADDKSMPQIPTDYSPVGEPLYYRDLVIWLLVENA